MAKHKHPKGTQRIHCISCGKRFRSTKLREWEHPPQFELQPQYDPKTEEVLRDEKGQVIMKRVCTYAGLRLPRHEECRACFKMRTGAPRPTGRRAA